MKMSSVVAVFGLSGVGKSWMIGRYTAQSSALHVQASQVLREAKLAASGESLTSEQLRKGAVLDNQTLLIQEFARIRSAEVRPIIFDGHCVVDDGKQLLEIPSKVISELGVSSLVFVEGTVSEIVERRKSDTMRVRPTRSETDLTYHQQRAKAVCEGYSHELKLPMEIVSAGDENAFTQALRKFLRVG